MLRVFFFKLSRQLEKAGTFLDENFPPFAITHVRILRHLMSSFLFFPPSSKQTTALGRATNGRSLFVLQPPPCKTPHTLPTFIFSPAPTTMLVIFIRITVVYRRRCRRCEKGLCMYRGTVILWWCGEKKINK